MRPTDVLALLRCRLAIVLTALLAGSCAKQQPPPPAPVRINTPAVLPASLSSFTVPVSIPLVTLQQALERGAPRQLWSIDERKSDCIPAQRIKLLKTRLKVTPDISCRIVGQVTRGPIRLKGNGNRILIDIPLQARISVRDVGKILKGETATGSAIVRASLALKIDQAWRPRSKVQLSYDWQEPPGIDFLGKRVSFAGRADRELAKLITQLEVELQKEIDKVPVRTLVEKGWREGFAVIELNRENPPAWMRVTPRGLGLAGYSVSGRDLRVIIAGLARVETLVGPVRPSAPKVGPLPPPITPRPGQLHFVAGVLGDYRELEPVVLRALRRLNSKGIVIDRIGRIEALFDQVTIYQTEGGRLALGIDAGVRRLDARISALDLKSKGTVWLTGVPYNQTNSTELHVRDLQLFGHTDNRATNLLFRVVNTPEMRAAIAEALKQDLAKDYSKVMSAARKAIANKRFGDFRLEAKIDKVQHGSIEVTGEGLLLPVTATGSAILRLND